MEFHLVLSPLLHFSARRAIKSAVTAALLACYGNKASHMCFSVCICVCVFVQLEYWEEEQSGKETSVYLSKAGGEQEHDKINRPHREITSTTTFQRCKKITKTLIMFTYMKSSSFFTQVTLKISTLGWTNLVAHAVIMGN